MTSQKKNATLRQCKTNTDDTDQDVRRVETRSFPNSLAATLRGFTFYLADPRARLRRFTQIRYSGVVIPSSFDIWPSAFSKLP
jgi:hypothetical protein